MARLKITFLMSGPSIVIRQMANRMEGMAFRPSHSRMRMWSSTLLALAYSPSNVPMKPAERLTHSPTTMEVRVP